MYTQSQLSILRALESQMIQPSTQTFFFFFYNFHPHFSISQTRKLHRTRWTLKKRKRKNVQSNIWCNIHTFTIETLRTTWKKHSGKALKKYNCNLLINQLSKLKKQNEDEAWHTKLFDYKWTNLRFRKICIVRHSIARIVRLIMVSRVPYVLTWVNIVSRSSHASNQSGIRNNGFALEPDPKQIKKCFPSFFCHSKK